MTRVPQNPVPRPGPEPMDKSRSLTGVQEKVVTPAIEGARARQKGLCYDYIKGNSKEDPLKVLEDLQRGGGIRYKPGDNLVGSARYGGRGSNDTIYLYDRFFNAQEYTFTPGSRVVLNKEMYQQEAILYELRHVLVGGHNNRDTGEDYDRNILDFCFPVQNVE